MPKHNDFTEILFINMDEVPINFDCDSYSIYEFKGSKKISVKKTCQKKKVLAMLSNGLKLPPYIIFKNEWLKCITKFPK